MEPGSPHLIHQPAEAPEQMVTVVMDTDTAVVELQVSGEWTHRLWLQARDTLRKSLANHPLALIVDLLTVGDPRAVSAPLWLTARAQGAAMHPPVAVVVCVPPSSALAARMRRFEARWVPVYGTVRQARAALVGRRSLSDRLRLSLPPRREAAVWARALVGEACHGWGVPGLAHRARLVVSELVVNAVEHGGTPIEVIVSRRGAPGRTPQLHLAVCDRDSRLPQVAVPQSGALGALGDRGLGLRIVDAAADVWGALPTRDGKMVWAVLRAHREAAS